MIKKYRTGSYGRAIEEVEVERETEKSVWMKGQRSEKMTNYSCYFNTWQEAHDHILKKSLNEMSIAKSRYDSAKKRYQDTLSLKEQSE